EAAAAARLQAQGRSLRAVQARGLGEPCARAVVEDELGCVRHRLSAALETPGRVLRPLDRRGHVGVLEHVEVHVDAEPAAVLAGAARALAQLDLLEEPRVLRFPHLRGREACRRLAVVDEAAGAVVAARRAHADRMRRAVGPGLAGRLAYAPPHETRDV